MNTTTAPSTAEFLDLVLKTAGDVAGLPLGFVYLTWLGCRSRRTRLRCGLEGAVDVHGAGRLVIDFRWASRIKPNDCMERFGVPLCGKPLK
jgi:hypothetical protein